MAAPVLQSAGPSNIDETLTLSLVNLIPGIRDNVFNSNPALKWLYGKNKTKKRGGPSLSHGILYGTNSTAQSYQRYDILDTTPQDGLTRDQWAWAQYAVSVTIDGFTERIANAGDSVLIEALETKKNQAEEALSALLERHIFAASPGTKDIRSLPTIILDSGTEGQISGTTNSWWQGRVTTSGSFAAQGRADMTTMYNALMMRNPAGVTELILSDQTAFEAYESSLVSQERFTSNETGDIGFRNLLFKDTPWTWSPQATSGVIYFLHSKALEFVVNADTDFKTTDFVKPYNQDARTAQILLACAMIAGVRRKLGKLTSVTA
jgi:hypothetical protein